MVERTKKQSESTGEKKFGVNQILVVLLIIAAFFLGNLYTRVKTLEKGVGTTGQPSAQQGAVPTVPAKVDLTVADDDPYLGPKDAKVTVVEFADFQCPFCGAFSGLNKEMVTNMQSRDASWQPAESNIIKDYVKTNKVRFVWKDYPFLGQESIWAAAAARCAEDQGKFWEYHDYLFTNQKGENQGAFSKENLKKFAATLGFNTGDFNSCLDSGKHEKKVQDAISYGQSVGVNGTPATYVNGKLISGAASYSQFKTLIDEDLK